MSYIYMLSGKICVLYPDSHPVSEHLHSPGTLQRPKLHLAYDLIPTRTLVQSTSPTRNPNHKPLSPSLMLAQTPPQATMSYIGAAQRRHEVTATSVLNFVLSDGCTLIATRYVYPESEAPASLYYAEGECPPF